MCRGLLYSFQGKLAFLQLRTLLVHLCETKDVKVLRLLKYVLPDPMRTVYLKDRCHNQSDTSNRQVDCKEVEEISHVDDFFHRNAYPGIRVATC